MNLIPNCLAKVSDQVPASVCTQRLYDKYHTRECFLKANQYSQATSLVRRRNEFICEFNGINSFYSKIPYS